MARRNRIYPNPLGAILRPGDARDVAHGGLCHGIQGPPWPRRCAAMLELLMMDPPLRSHHPNRMLDAEHDAADQQLHAVVELLFGDRIDFAGSRRAGVVEQAIELPESLDGCIDDGGDFRFVHHVGSMEHRLLRQFCAQEHCRALSERPAMTTRAPSATKRRAVASPMPLVAPVMTATFPSNLPGILLSPLRHQRRGREYHYPRSARKAPAAAAPAAVDIRAWKPETVGLADGAVWRSESSRLFHISVTFCTKC